MVYLPSADNNHYFLLLFLKKNILSGIASINQAPSKDPDQGPNCLQRASVDEKIRLTNFQYRLKPVLVGVRIVALSRIRDFPLVLMNRLNKPESVVFLYCRFSLFLKDPFSRLFRDRNSILVCIFWLLSPECKMYLQKIVGS